MHNTQKAPLYTSAVFSLLYLSFSKVVVRCKTSYTGLFSFLAIPLLMGDIMIEFMNMIDINGIKTITLPVVIVLSPQLRSWSPRWQQQQQQRWPQSQTTTTTTMVAEEEEAVDLATTTTTWTRDLCLATQSGNLIRVHIWDRKQKVTSHLKNLKVEFDLPN